MSSNLFKMTSPLAPLYAGMSDGLLRNWYLPDRLPPFQQFLTGALGPKRSVLPRIGRSVTDAGKLAVGEMSDKFQVIVNVSHFKPEEVSVKVIDKYIVIHGKHEEKADEHGFVMREFTRKYLLPESVDEEKLTSTVSKNGILIVQAPLKVVEPPASNVKVVPITIETPNQDYKTTQ
ncbi:alpha-crystallin A chain-like [Stegodyphus dumicola]|uniref:alpha-crystallin A chain-like n=1 Tax=Stegodyphus dumicola TaxID=202533 RepID=UPI0015AE7415|nr:alpha-crystallin A chain-like [Stegodyphus dumicola]